MRGTKNYNLQYDAYGNISSRVDGVSFTYDAAGSLRFSNKGAASQMAYQYDASGTRVLSAGNGINKLEFTAANGLLLYEINREFK